MPSLRPCPGCGTHIRLDVCVCPFCGGRSCASDPRSSTRAAALLSLALVACGPIGGQTKYGVPDTGFEDHDGDGWGAAVDCDDDDAAIHPEAVETPGDGVDSNCNQDDDT